ncbi:unnamed protein product, partial [Prorocentrum cordatum]
STWGNWLGLCSATAKSVPLASRRHEFLTQNALLGQGRAARMSGPTPQARLRVSKQAPPHVWRPTPAGRRWGGPCEARRGCSWCGAADTRGGHDGHSLSGPTAGANWHVKIGGKKASMQEDGKEEETQEEGGRRRDGRGDAWAGGGPPLGTLASDRTRRSGRAGRRLSGQWSHPSSPKSSPLSPLWRPSWEHAAKEPQSRPWAIPHIRGLVCRGSRHRARGVPSRSSTVGGMKRGQGKAEQKQMRDGPLGASSRCRKPRKGRQRPSNNNKM